MLFLADLEAEQSFDFGLLFVDSHLQLGKAPAHRCIVRFQRRGIFVVVVACFRKLCIAARSRPRVANVTIFCNFIN